MPAIHSPIPLAIKDSAHWEELRRTTLNGGEAAALFETVANEFDVTENVKDVDEYEEDGEPMSPYMSPLGLWALKSGRIEPRQPSANSRVQWARQIEPIIADTIASKSGWVLRRPSEYYMHPAVRGMGLKLRYEVEVDGTGVFYPLVVKTVAVEDRWKWRNAVGEWVIPGHILIEMQHILSITGLPHAYLGILIGGCEDRMFVVERDESLIFEIEGAVADFWDAVDLGREPAANMKRDAWVIKRLYLHVDPQNVVDRSDDAEIKKLVADMRYHSSQSTVHKKAADELRQQLTAMIGDAKHVLLGDAVVNSSIIEGSHVSYYREPYRKVTVSKLTKKHAGLPLTSAA